ncbi:hypothetical protein [Burkholderia stagnalis]|uniref:hypothetical protein n=1 Tax=Burkholderia stagnalis TaxID=1503054 RepID=UPI0012DA2C26|nr:hypothetical protein [Burkholderia stagnalis]
MVANVFVGGNGDRPHAFATSDEAQQFSDVVRGEWPDKHLVTRMDSAEDFYESGGYDRLQKVTRKIARAHRLSFASVSDELDDTAGRTQYIGSRSSEYMGRLYEKGWEVVGKTVKGLGVPWNSIETGSVVSIPNGSGEMIDPASWVRLELQARPKSEAARRAAAIATPEQAWTFTKWSSALAKAALSLDMERFYVRMHKVSADDEQAEWLCYQYGGLLDRMKADLGDWDCVGRELGRRVERLRKMRGGKQ